MQQVKTLLQVSLTASIIQFGYELGRVIDASSYIFFLLAVIYDAMFEQNIDIGTYQSSYVGHIILQSKVLNCLLFESYIASAQLILNRNFAMDFRIMEKGTL